MFFLFLLLNIMSDTFTLKTVPHLRVGRLLQSRVIRV